MGSNAIIDVAIGLVLMYLVLSLVCTVVNEFVATVLNLRATTLKGGIEQLLDVSALQKDVHDHGLIAGVVASKGSYPSYLPGRTFAMAVLGSLDPSKPLPVFADIETAVKNLPDSNTRDALLSHLVTAGGDIEKLRDAVATWFDHAMDRVTGIYQRYLKYISLAVGLILAATFNADSITVGKAMWSDGALRAEMVQAAAEIIAAPPAASSAGGVGVKASVVERIKAAEATLRPLPVGWNLAVPGADWTGWDLLLKIAGLAMTGLALSLGAPFWFDLLSKFMNLRGTGKKPERSTNA